MELEEECSFARYARPRTPAPDPARDLHLMVLDVEGLTEFDRRRQTEVSRLRCFAVDRAEGTYLLHLTDFFMYFYVEFPLQEPGAPAQKLLAELTAALERHAQVEPGRLLRGAELVRAEDLMNYKGAEGARLFVKLTLWSHERLARVRGWFEDERELGGACFPRQTFESQIGYPLRFMVDHGLAGMAWVTLPAGCFTVLPAEARVSRCRVELALSAERLVAHAIDEPEFSDIAPLRVLSFDIEACNKEHFPEAQQDPVITIGLVWKLHNARGESGRAVLQLDTCEPLLDVDLRTFAAEEALLAAFDRFLLTYDPDVLSGYNSANFDFPYLFNRNRHLGRPPVNWGRLREGETRLTKGKFMSKAMGFRETEEMNFEGRVHLDMFVFMLAEKKLRSYSLNYVSYYFLNRQKEDVAWQMIHRLQAGSPAERRKIASYCLKDAQLSLALLEKMKCVYNYAEMARVTGVPIKYLFTRGQQIKVLAQLFRKTRERGMLIPHRRRGKGDAEENQYEGADVLEPQKGFYRVPIATLDFASLYPSIVIAHNMCYSTLVRPERLRELDPAQYRSTPAATAFVTKEVRLGVLCEIMEQLLLARKRAKGELEAAKRLAAELATRAAAEPNPAIQARLEAQRFEVENLADVLDGRQLALKISANSVYGFTGAGVGSLPCIEIAASVTAIGRAMIHRTRDRVTEHFCAARGYAADAEVIYGDTDSVMINFKEPSLARTMELGREAAQLLTGEFERPVRLEFEKAYFPFLLISKKRYAGLIYTCAERSDKKDTKGVESVRRDNCLLVKTMVDKVLDILLYEMDVEKAVRYVQGTIQDLNRGKVDISQLIITRSITRSIDDDSYKARQSHVEVARKIKQRNPAWTVKVGDRIPYVIVCGGKNARNYERSEDPLWVFEKQIPLDINYYIEDQIKPPLARIFSAVLDVRRVFEGQHMVPKLAPNAGFGLGKFMARSNGCLGCRAEVPAVGDAPAPPLCANCAAAPRPAELYFAKAMEQKTLEWEFTRLWSECQRCEGAMLQEVICSNVDCPIFFRRTKLRAQLDALAPVLERFAQS